jgi:hypothetical protein
MCDCEIHNPRPVWPPFEGGLDADLRDPARFARPSLLIEPFVQERSGVPS